MARSKRLIVGLGNPGAEYEETRHNVGFWVIDALAERTKTRLASEHHALVGWTSHRGCPLGLVKPLTYVNRSGEAVQQLVRAHALDARELLVVVDDLHLAPGTIRLRAGGGSGGHNGMESIIERLGTQAIPRLRLGIEGDYRRGQQADFVLSPFSREERPLIDEAVERAIRAALTYVTEGLETAMNEFN